MNEATYLDPTKLTKPPAHVRTITEVVQWLRAGGRSTWLDLGYPFAWTTHDIQVLVDSAALPRLKALVLHGIIGVEGAHALAQCPRLDHLTHFSLGASLDEDGVTVLAASPFLTRLTYLDLHNDSGHLIRGLAGPRAMEALAASTTLARLQVLLVRDNRIGDEGVQALATAPQLTALRVLDLSGCRLTDRGAHVLASSTLLERLTTLDLSRNVLTDGGVSALAQAPQVATLEWLSLRACRLSDAGAYALAGSRYLGHVATLDLRDNAFGVGAKGALARSPALANTTLLME